MNEWQYKGPPLDEKEKEQQLRLICLQTAAQVSGDTPGITVRLAQDFYNFITGGQSASL